MSVMTRATINGVELEYDVRGTGEPIVLIHWGVSASWAEPLLSEPALEDGYQLLSYHRAGFGDSSRLDRPVSIADHAEHCRLLMRRLGLERAHVVGHSSSAVVALQLAVDHPEVVHSLALLEPARPAPPTEVQAGFVRDVVQPAMERYQAGDVSGAVDHWARGVFGPGYEEALERGLPGARERCIADAEAFFEQELPAVQQWQFTQVEAGRVTQPVLIVLGENTVPTFPERVDLLLSWLPNGERSELSRATHLLHIQDPHGVAEALVRFFARHPLAA
jgi:pimeloyl-ACP methyl ester carboxylesterase